MAVGMEQSGKGGSFGRVISGLVKQQVPTFVARVGREKGTPQRAPRGGGLRGRGPGVQKLMSPFGQESSASAGGQRSFVGRGGVRGALWVRRGRGNTALNRFKKPSY